MRHSSPAPLLRRVAAAALLLAAGLAQAQFVWVDPKGVRHYSDQPPPPGTPPARILKAPGLPAAAQPLPAARPAATQNPAALDGAGPAPAAQAPATSAGTVPAPAPAASKPAAKGPQTLAEKDADFRKRLKDSQEAEQKARDQARTDAQKTEHCTEVRKARQLYESGIRIAEMGPDGQKRYLNDAERAQRSARASAMAAECR